MNLVSSFVEMVHQVSCVMTVPTFASFVTVVTGWVFARRHTVTGMILAADAVGTKHHSAFHRLFAKAEWVLDDLGLSVFGLISPWLRGHTVMLALDDTLARKRGNRLASPRAMLTGRARRVTLDIYGRGDKVRMMECAARVHAVPDRPLRIVAVEPLSGGRRIQAFYSTRHDASAEQVLVWYAMRWSIEVAFQNSKTHLGFEQPQGWTRHAVERTSPTAMLLYSLIVLWFARQGHRHYRPLHRPWYRTKRHPSFADMLATLRCQSLREQVSSAPPSRRGTQKVMRTLLHAVQQAA